MNRNTQITRPLTAIDSNGRSFPVMVNEKNVTYIEHATTLQAGKTIMHFLGTRHTIAVEESVDTVIGIFKTLHSIGRRLDPRQAFQSEIFYNHELMAYSYQLDEGMRIVFCDGSDIQVQSKWEEVFGITRPPAMS